MEDEHRDPPRGGALGIGGEARVGAQRGLPDLVAPLVLDLFGAKPPALALDVDLALRARPQVVAPRGVMGLP
jgi:hypothetical protein